MNERIQELAEQAELTKGVWAVPDFILQRFAELIVKETITEMCQQLYWHGEDQSNNPSFYKAIDKTKKHFGVEE